MNWQQLVEERDAWIAHNFPQNYIPAPGESLLGMIEETGELAHAYLKNLQSIRDETDASYETNAKDAIGDITIYMLGVMSHGRFVPEREPTEFLTKADACIRGIANFVGLLAVSPSQYYCEKIIGHMKRFCDTEGWNYERIVRETWDHVKQRDWIAYPDTGMPA